MTWSGKNAGGCMSEKLLIAEDDKDIVELLKLYLENEGFRVIAAYDGKSAYDLFIKERPDLAILDIMMPEMNGYELTQKIREKSNIPLIILSAKTQDSDKILGLDIGADDYITKPFNPLEVVARVKSTLRRYLKLNKGMKEAEENVLSVGVLRLDTKRFTLYKREEEILLTPTEFKILAMLMEKPGRVFTRVQIYERINGEYFMNDDNTIMVHISKLREKLEDDSKNPVYLKTVRGLGYKIEKIEKME